jgi:alanyl-tRNA synthetase
MNRKQLIKKYIDFFKSKNHKEIPNSSLIPENDPTVLFTTAGMHPLVPYLLGQKHAQGKRLVNNQKCIRTGDIEEVGDEIHHTFFEMLGNWSLGDYWKKEAIEYSIEFLTKILKIPKKEISITCFKGDKDAPKDTESAEIWESLGISKNKIKFLPKSENWWGPAGKTGPCGPDTEMFVKEVEIWNDVLMQYNKDVKGNYNIAKQQNVDTGMGVERTVAILQGVKDNYMIDCWKPIIKKIEYLSREKYGKDKETTKTMRIIADHIKASVFIIADGITPSNTEQGYVLRRLLRRAVMNAKKLNIKRIVDITDPVFDIYDDYKLNKKLIKQEIEKEEERFDKTLETGLRKLSKMCSNKKISGKQAFLLFQSYGFPLEMTIELAKEKNIKVDKECFKKELAKHQKLSRTATEGKFKSGLADNSEQVTKLHTATHLLNQALRIVLKKPDIFQRGSNITAERLRFDFNFDRKLTDQEKSKIEDWINNAIKQKLPIKCEEMTLEQAKKAGAQGVFESKYKEKVKVYSVCDVSTEICAGPHVNNTKELGKFKIKKEESSSAGVRRIKGVLE